MAQLFLLNDKAEAALAAIVMPAAGTAQVFTGKTATDKQPPPVIICSAAAEEQEDPRGSGNFFVNCSVAIKTGAVVNEDGTAPADADQAALAAAVKAQNQALVAAVYGAVMVADLDAQMSEAINDFTVFPASVQFGAPESGRDANGVWIDVLHFRCYACGSALS